MSSDARISVILSAILRAASVRSAVSEAARDFAFSFAVLISASICATSSSLFSIAFRCSAAEALCARTDSMSPPYLRLRREIRSRRPLYSIEALGRVLVISPVKVKVCVSSPCYFLKLDGYCRNSFSVRRRFVRIFSKL